LDYKDKLYVAHFNRPESLLRNGDKTGAAKEFAAASTVDPSRSEAQAQILALTTTPVPPTPTLEPLDAFPSVKKLLSRMNNDTPAQPKLRAFEYFSETGKVNVDFNMDQNLTRDWTRDGLKMQMSALYIAIFHESVPAVKSASLRAWGPVTDRYGNNSYAMLTGTTLEATETSKINWKADRATLELEIIPGLWKTFLGSTSLGWPQSR
jgi:hypothetical protein